VLLRGEAGNTQAVMVTALNDASASVVAGELSERHGPSLQSL
jgi:hypothetical protein